MNIKPIRKLGKRSENFSGSGVRYANEVMAHEIYEFGNTDILETLSNTILRNTDIPFEDYINELQLNGYLENYEYEDVLALCDKLLHYIYCITGHKVNYALWLTDSDAITELYAKYEGDIVDYYPIGDIVLSDVEWDGKLYGYNELPVPVKSTETIIGVKFF